MPTATRRLVRDRRGAVALEFALIASGAIGLLMFVIFLGFSLYAQAALDYATSRAGRLLSVDATQALSHDAATFQAVSFCPLLAGLLSCANVVLQLQPVTDYLAASSTAPVADGVVQTAGLAFDPGAGSSLMLLQATYLVPIPGWPWAAASVVGLNGVRGITVSSAFPYQNEY